MSLGSVQSSGEAREQEEEEEAGGGAMEQARRPQTQRWAQFGNVSGVTLHN